MTNAQDILKQLSQQIEIKATNQHTILLVDGLNTFIRAFAATPTLSDNNGAHIGGITGFLLSIGAVIRTYRPKRVIIAFDGKNGSTRRRSIYPDYKMGRKQMVKLNRTYEFNSIDDEHDSRKWQLSKLIEILNYLPITLLYPDDIEADDTIAYIAQYEVTQGRKCLILSTDKDFLQLVNENIQVYNPIKKKLYNIDAVQQEYQFHPNNFLLYRAIIGDDSDNIKGIKGLGEKTLLKYFPMLKDEKKIDLTELISAAILLNEDKQSVTISNLLTNKSTIEINIKLMDLENVLIGQHTKLSILDIIQKGHNVFSSYNLTKLLMTEHIINAFHNYDHWVTDTFNYLTMK